jgi:hypothetical protein
LCFCGSSPRKEKEFLELANHLGRVVTERKIHLVYGGGNLVSTTLLGGTQILRVIPKALAKVNLMQTS